MIEKDQPDILITDILMPELDGISLVDQLKSDMATAHIPIISISAKISEEDQINALKHGIDIYINKPFHTHHVLAAVENLINKYSLLKKYFNSSISDLRVKEGKTIHRDDELFLNEIISFIEKNLEDENLNPNTLSDFLVISKATLYRKLKDLTNKTPSEYIKTIRLNYASKLLINTTSTVSEIMFKSGFKNKSYFYREFSKQFNKTPNEYRNKKTEEM